MQALAVLGELEDLPVIGPHPLEHGTAVMQRMGEDMHLGVLPGAQLAVQPDEALALIVRGRRRHRTLPPKRLGI